MGLHVPLYNLIPLYFLAVIIGIFSMIPGGIGSFDLIVITGLTSMGVSNALAVSLLLLFRLTYYIIPFLLGVVFFFKHMGGRINEKYFKISSRVFGGSLHRFLVYLLRFSGIFLILSALIPERLANVYFISRFNPIQGTVDLAIPKYPIWNPIHFHGSSHQTSGEGSFHCFP